jgi:RNA polymerase sigma-70 factor (ECF subfamily)
VTLTIRAEVRADPMDDHDLIRQAAGGDQPAFEALVRRNTPAVWRMARSMLNDDMAAEEAVQDTFLKAYRNLHTFRGEAKVSTWLLTICHRACIDRLRLKRADVVSLDAVRRERGREDRPELRLALEAALADLPHEEREAFVLVAVTGHSREEAAEIVGVPASTMRSRVARARQRLAEALGDAREEAAGGGE